MKSTKCLAKQKHTSGKKSENIGEERKQKVKVKTAVSLLNGRVQKYDPPYMDHLCGPGPWTLLWTRWTNPRGPPLIFEDEFLPKV